MACCSIPAITMRLSQTTLQELVGILLMVLIDGGIQAMPQGGCSMRSSSQSLCTASCSFVILQDLHRSGDRQTVEC